MPQYIWPSFLNPIDLSRVQMLLQIDISALMGYTGAVFREFFGNSLGIVISFLGLLLWIVVPLFISLKKFENKDLQPFLISSSSKKHRCIVYKVCNCTKCSNYISQCCPPKRIFSLCIFFCRMHYGAVIFKPQ